MPFKLTLFSRKLVASVVSSKSQLTRFDYAKYIVLFTLLLHSNTFAAEKKIDVLDKELKLVFTIKEPNVIEPRSLYKDIFFYPGDKVFINAGGCVQTGGLGRTWKRYVNPSGPKSDKFYHGLIHIPGSTNGTGLVRTKDVIGKEIKINDDLPGFDTSKLYLNLGYEDDKYSDNGYWGRSTIWRYDDGTEEQCKGEGNAYIEITIIRTKKPPIPFGKRTIK